MTKTNPKPKVGGPRVRPKNPVRRVRESGRTSDARPKPTEADYDVGYKRPPKSKQFKPGVSGNPKGRPRGAKGHMASLKKELNSLVTATKNGREVQITKLDAYFTSLMNNLIKVPGRHQLEFLRFLEALDEKEAHKSSTENQGAKQDDEKAEEIIRRFKQRVAREIKKADNDDDPE